MAYKGHTRGQAQDQRSFCKGIQATIHTIHLYNVMTSNLNLHDMINLFSFFSAQLP
jgi:hypothetical protein